MFVALYAYPQAALAAQAARMTSLASRLPRGADVIPLNVGGQLLATSRRTLTLVPDSLLGTMFSGHWDEHLTRWGRFQGVCVNAGEGLQGGTLSSGRGTSLR